MSDHDLQHPTTPSTPEALDAERMLQPAIEVEAASAHVATDTGLLDTEIHAAGAEAAPEAGVSEAEVDAEAVEPGTADAPAETAVAPAAQPVAEPIPDISTLSAAKDAAAFVAQIFADPSISDTADSEVTAVEAAAEQVEVVELPPVPAQWPQGQAQHLQGQRVLVLGLGISGIAMARGCVRAGADVTVADTREAPPHLPTLQAELPGVRFVAGELTAALVDGQSLSAVYRSPGLSPETVAAVFDAARAIGLPVGGELDLFAMALKGLAQAQPARSAPDGKQDRPAPGSRTFPASAPGARRARGNGPCPACHRHGAVLR